MSTLRALLRPSIFSSAPFHHHHNVVRAYGAIGSALRLLEKDHIARTKLEASKGRRLANSSRQRPRCFGTSSAAANAIDEENLHSEEANRDHQWPRLVDRGVPRTTCRNFHEQFNKVASGDVADDEVQVCGRIWSIRSAGSKLAFVDLRQDGSKLQILCNFQDLEPKGVTAQNFKRWGDSLQRGHIISAIGRPHRTKRRELSLLVSELPSILSSCIRPLPTSLENEQVRMRLRHVDLLLHPRAVQYLKLGADIKKFLREYLERDGHVSVKTPILAAAAGGAIANPFTINSKTRRNLALRIAPELWLKRLIIGGFERVYEIGPCFRDEGQSLESSSKT